MRATVIEIISGSRYTDGKRRVKLSFDVGEGLFKELKIKEEDLGRHLKLDDVVEFNIVPISSVVKLREEPLPVQGDEVVDGA